MAGNGRQERHLALAPLTEERRRARASVTIERPDGVVEIREGGTAAWRNKSRQIDAGAWANRHGAIGRNGPRAVFPDEAAGQAAMRLTLVVLIPVEDD